MVNDEKVLYGLPSDEELLSILNKRIDESITISETWREMEVRDNYALFEGNQWLREDLDRQIKNAMPIMTINRTAPILESICGFEIQNRQQVRYVPRLLDKEQSEYNDIMNDVVRYIEQNSGADIQYSQAFKDMLICGVGATDTTINYDNNPDGEAIIERIFPAFLLWDSSARAKNISDADFIIRLKVLNQDAIKQLYGEDYFDSTYDGALDARIMEFFDEVLAVKTLGVIYEYQWRQKEPFYRIENPFKKLNTSLYDQNTLIMLLSKIDELSQIYNFDPELDGLFSVETTKEANDIIDSFALFNIELKKSKQFKYKYYRAIVTGGKVVEKAENYTQTGFSIKFMTGQFSELDQCYYALGRSCKNPQRILNQSVSDYVGFLQTVPKGGVDIEVDAVDDIKAFVDTYTKASFVTVYNSGGLMKSRPKVTPPIPSGILEMIQYADSQIMQVCGVTPELMGLMASKEMNSSFYRQQIKQGLTTLSTYFDAKRAYMRNQGYLYTDCVRILTKNAEGRLIKNVTGESSAPYMQLTQDRINAEYDVVLEEMPTSPDQNYEIFQKLVELQGTLASKQNPVDIMPLVLEASPFSQEIKDKLLEAIQPPPPAEPDPLNQAILESEINYKNASAEKLKAEAFKIEIDARTGQEGLRYVSPTKEADIEYQQARAENEYSKTIKNASELPLSLANLIL